MGFPPAPATVTRDDDYMYLPPQPRLLPLAAFPAYGPGMGRMTQDDARTAPGAAVDIDALEAGVCAGERRALARAITLVESRRESDHAAAQDLIERILPATGEAVRLGVTGVPGVGKSTAIEALGKRLTGAGRRVAVLAVDPSSGRTGGSILGDKTRMATLSADPAAFIRPSPSSGVLGGAGRATREALLLCEAAGFDVVIVETVGAGQADYVVADMVDTFLVLMLAGGGDELQGIKKGILEIADILAVNKADLDATATRRALRDYKSALHIVTPPDAAWTPPVLTLSGLTGEGVDDLWRTVQDHRAAMQASGDFERRRREQRLKWMWAVIEDRLMERFRRTPAVKALLAEIADAVAEGDMGATRAAADLLKAFEGRA